MVLLAFDGLHFRFLVRPDKEMDLLVADDHRDAVAVLGKARRRIDQGIVRKEFCKVL
jgi:hypothetical protein